MIAHRLSTVEECDNIFFLEKGEVILEGKYAELIQIKKFREFALLD